MRSISARFGGHEATVKLCNHGVQVAFPGGTQVYAPGDELLLSFRRLRSWWVSGETLFCSDARLGDIALEMQENGDADRVARTMMTLSLRLRDEEVAPIQDDDVMRETDPEESRRTHSRDDPELVAAVPAEQALGEGSESASGIRLRGIQQRRRELGRLELVHDHDDSLVNPHGPAAAVDHVQTPPVAII
jgi:hypothetical protein